MMNPKKSWLCSASIMLFSLFSCVTPMENEFQMYLLKSDGVYGLSADRLRLLQRQADEVPGYYSPNRMIISDKTLYYISASNIMKLPVGGEGTLIYSGHPIALTSFGDIVIALCADDEDRLQLQYFASGRFIRLLNLPLTTNYYIKSFECSPQGHWIAITMDPYVYIISTADPTSIKQYTARETTFVDDERIILMRHDKLGRETVYDSNANIFLVNLADDSESYLTQGRKIIFNIERSNAFVVYRTESFTDELREYQVLPSGLFHDSMTKIYETEPWEVADDIVWSSNSLNFALVTKKKVGDYASDYIYFFDQYRGVSVYKSRRSTSRAYTPLISVTVD